MNGRCVYRVGEKLQQRQIGLYFVAVAAGIAASLVPGADALQGAVNPALALMLFATFLQIPLAAGLVQPGPFVQAFVWLIAVPLAGAALMQLWAARARAGARACTLLAVAAVPATAAVLFLVIAAALPQIGSAADAVLRAVPIYVAFAMLAPMVGWFVARLFSLDAPAGRSIAFSTATRNSLVVLPLALAVPGAVPLLPAVVIAQTLVELASELLYIRVLPRIGSRAA